MLPVNGQIQTHELGEFGIIESKHFGVVGGPIQIVIDGADALAALVCVAVDGGCNDWQLSNQVNAVFIGGFPVLCLVHTLKFKTAMQTNYYLLSAKL